MMKVCNFFEKAWADMFGRVDIIEDEEDSAESILQPKQSGREEPDEFSFINMVIIMH